MKNPRTRLKLRQLTGVQISSKLALMFRRWFWLPFILSLSGGVSADAFRLSLLSEPHTLNPQTTAAGGGNYLFHNLYHGLYRYQKGLKLEGAKDCTRQRRRLICHLNPLHKWSNGERVKAQDYVESAQHLIDPNSKSPQSELLLKVKNAHAIGRGELPVQKLGVSVIDSFTVQFDFDEEDLEFEYKLTVPALAPWPPGGYPERGKGAELLVTGPYRIDEWKVSHWIHLLANKNYLLGANPARPEIQVFFIDDDATALQLYEAGKLDFLRRLVSQEIPRFKGRPDFYQFAMARFDYIGFGPQLEEHPKLREALTLAVDFDGFQKLFAAKGAPGCPSLPARLMDHVPCERFNPEAARRALQADPVKDLKLELHFSLLGGDDIARAAEWFQGQWKKNLGLSIELKGVEQGVYLQRLRAQPPSLFRKGVSLDRTTCLAALELFTSDSPENYLRLKSPTYDQLVKDLGAQETSTQKQVACRKAIEYLLNTHRLIPMGEMYFTLLASPKFKGWELNELNQLDLSQLHRD
jgi:oligopeptide transport system substrate-binding protein